MRVLPTDWCNNLAYIMLAQGEHLLKQSRLSTFDPSFTTAPLFVCFSVSITEPICGIFTPYPHLLVDLFVIYALRARTS